MSTVTAAGAALLGLALYLVPVASAQDVPPAPPPVDEALQRLKDSLLAEPNLSPETKAAMASFFESLAARQAQLDTVDVAALQRLAAEQPATPGRWQKVLEEQLTISGDFRIREEYSFDLDDQKSRARTRTRFRLGAEYAVDEELTAGAQLRTGDPADPNSPHTTWGDGFDSKAFDLSRLYLAYKPNGVSGLKVLGGKFANPFYVNPVYGELVWDADVNPEGFAGVWSIPGDEKGEKLDLVLGEYIALEQGGGSEVNIFVAQAAGTEPLSENSSGTLALGVYNYGQLTPDGAQALVADNPSQTAGGNATVDSNGDGTPDNYASEFLIWNPIAAYTYTGWSRPVTFSAEYIKNTMAEGSQDTGVAVGANVGQQKQAGDWQWYYQWQNVEQDAVFAAFAQDDFLLTANQTGHVFGTKYRITKDVGLHLWGLVSSRDELGGTATTNSHDDQWRTRLDLDVRF